MLTWIRNIPIHCDILRVHDCSFILTQLFIKIKKNKKKQQRNKQTRFRDQVQVRDTSRDEFIQNMYTTLPYNISKMEKLP